MKDGIVIRNRFRTALILCDDIYYIEKNLRKVFVFTKDEEFWEYGKMERVHELMDRRFFRCHKSLIINMDKLVSFGPDSAVMDDGRMLHMCHSYLRKTKKRWIEYISYERGKD